MKREKEFKEYLESKFSNVGTVKDYINYCKKIEETF